MPNESIRSRVHRTWDPASTTVQHMGVDHCGPHIFMTEQFLNRANVVAAFKQMGGEAMPESVAACVFGNTRFADGILHSFLNRTFRQVVLLFLLTSGIDRPMRCRKHILPSPLLWSVRILAGERVRQKNFSIPSGEIVIVQ